MSNFTNLVFIRAKAGRSEDLGKALLSLVAPSRAEDACLSYDVHHSNDDPDLRMVYENWRSAGDLDGHFALPHMQAFVARIPDLVEGDLDLRSFTRLSDAA
ncbi:antibiotic biosynthesis monooxygenase [Sphingomonas oleivorans]|uniref:Antibiotic biosynthesis monooxygenase n=1 Tax=Sphingomonas oleivorans TaxID=1735121 RepID=A0A2T5FU88_9SPHN|nr:putative quinol monooxygenase [Sphingomonas oleivorans]PTQ07855.1 antibiotic biosynthesis monooxygenase [Sphingomonas oleivorans]